VVSVVGGQYQPFDVVATLRNNGTATATNVELLLGLPDELDADTWVEPIGNLAPGQERQVTWSVRAAPGAPNTGIILNYRVSVQGSNIDPKTVERQITLPAISSGLPGDANDDCVVDGVDYTILLAHYGQQTQNGHRDGDFDGNGVVDGVDYVILLNHYGQTCTTPTP
jgi:hypothetical protein